ncbi:MAG: hypothetical protein WCN92_02380 [Eubacteriales bacterium]
MITLNEDAFIKSVIWGGFNKEDVLKYIEKIQSEHIVEIDKIKQKNAETEKTFFQIKQLEEELAAERSRFAALTALNDEYCEKIYSLEDKQSVLNNKLENMQDDCNRIKNVESQIGTLLLDAVLYSDKMTQKAKQAAKSITDNAKQAIYSTNDDVSRLGTDISQIAGNFSTDISELIARIESLSFSLTSYASDLENEIDAPQNKSNAEQETFAHFLSEYNNENDEDGKEVLNSTAIESTEKTSEIAETIEKDEPRTDTPTQTDEINVDEAIEEVLDNVKTDEDI